MSDFNTAYSQTDHYFGADPEAILGDFCTELDPDYPVLDVGCGQGRNTLALARYPDKRFRVLAIDPSTAAIRTVQEIADAEQLPVLTAPHGFESIDEGALAKLTGSTALSAVLLFGLLQILPVETIRTFLGQAGRLLTKDGFLFITAFSTAGPDFERHQQTWHAIGDNSFRNPQNPADLRTYFPPNQILEWLDCDHFLIRHHREYLGPLHRHSDTDPLHQHAMIELVAQRR